MGGEEVCSELLHSSRLVVLHWSAPTAVSTSSPAALVLMRRRGRLLHCGCCCSICFRGDTTVAGLWQRGIRRWLTSLELHPMTVFSTGRLVSMVSQRLCGTVLWERMTSAPLEQILEAQNEI